MSLLEELKAKRGYLLPYHRMLAAHQPDLLRRYDAFYEKLTLDQNILTPFEKEFVWIAILACAREGVGSLHLDRAKAAGMTQDEMEIALALSALSESFPAFAFGINEWNRWLDADRIAARYLALVDQTRAHVAPDLGEMALLVCHGVRRDRRAFALHLRRFADWGGTADRLSEALSYLFIPMGANLLIEIVELWSEVAAESGLLPPYG